MAARTGARPPMPPDPLESGEFDTSQQQFDNPGRYSNNNYGDKKGNGCIIALVAILALIVVVVALIALDVGGIRSNHIMGFVRNAPIIGSLFTPQEVDPYEEMTEAELRELVRVQSSQIDSLTNQRDEANAQLAQANERIAHLSIMETRWQQFRVTSAHFAQTLAHNDPENFIEFFRDIVDYDLVPQDILSLAYHEARVIDAYNDDLRMLVSTLNNMEEGRAAEDLTNLLTHDHGLAVRLMRAMGSSRRAAILDEMTTTNSARFIMLLSTTPPTFAPLVPPPYLPEISPPVMPVATPPPLVVDTDGEDATGDDEYEETTEVEAEIADVEEAEETAEEEEETEADEE